MSRWVVFASPSTVHSISMGFIIVFEFSVPTVLPMEDCLSGKRCVCRAPKPYLNGVLDPVGMHEVPMPYLNCVLDLVGIHEVGMSDAFPVLPAHALCLHLCVKDRKASSITPCQIQRKEREAVLTL